MPGQHAGGNLECGPAVEITVIWQMASNTRESHDDNGSRMS